MANLKLGSSDVKQLLANYEAKQRQLQFEMDRIKATIKNLKSSLPELEKIETEQAAMIAYAEAEMVEISAPAAAPPKPRRGRPAGVAKKEPGKTAPRKAKAKTGKKKDRSSGYRLSEYDQLLFDVLNAHGRAMINSELIDHVEAAKREKGDTIVEGEAQKMIVRSLQKLANRRDDIRKVPYEGRGMAYALPEWLNGQGVIKKKHAHKA